jgi:hypothetical protein
MPKISELTSGGVIVATDELLALRSGANVRITVGNMSLQSAAAVAVTGGTINGTTLGASTPAAATVTSLTVSGNQTFSGANPVINGGDTDGLLILSAQTGTLGSNIQLYGSTHATNANDFLIYAGTTIRLHYDHSASNFDFQSNNVAIGGALSKGSGSFRIDHPLKPETHQLVHSFTESPQADLLYSGTANLVNGEAEINLDEHHDMTQGTFVALNRNIRVFTTNESDWEPIKGYVLDNILYISCQDATCSDSVSWLVIGERHDQHMMDTDWTDEQGRVIVEPLKVIPPEPTYVQRTITVEVEGKTGIKTEKVAERVDIIDGVATLIPESTKKVKVPLTKEIPVFNADGSPVMVQA